MPLTNPPIDATAAHLAADGRLDLLRNAASYSLQITNPNATGQGIAIVIGAAAYTVLAGRVSGDTFDRLLILGDGKHNWGPGNGATDTDLWRSAVGTLSSTSILNLARNASGYTGILNNPHATGAGWNITLGAATNAVLKAQVTGDAGYRFLADANGTMWWGPGTAGYDVYVYRSAAGVIRTDGAFFAQSGFITPIATKTSNYTLTATDNVILANAAMTATLPSAVTAGAGKQYTVKNRHASAAVTLGATAGTIDGAATLPLAPMQAVTAVSDGANWWVI